MSPNFKVPFPAGTDVSIQTYVGHNPDDKKMDIYADGWPHDSAVVAAAAGVVHEHFDPGGIEINHGDGWFTTYMHLDERAPVGRRVAQGEWVGKAGSVGTGAKHLHHEQLFAGPGATDADTGDMVRPTIQGVGPMKLVPGHPIRMRSTNTAPGHTQPQLEEFTMDAEARAAFAKLGDEVDKIKQAVGRLDAEVPEIGRKLDTQAGEIKKIKQAAGRVDAAIGRK